MLSLPSPTKLQRQYCHRQYLVTHLLAVGCILALLPGHTTATVLHCTSPTTAGFTVTRSPTDWDLDVTITSTEHTYSDGSNYSDQTLFPAEDSELVISEGLQAGTQYTISGNGTSSIQCITKPNPPVITDVTSISTSSMTVQFTQTDTHVTSVIVRYQGAGVSAAASTITCSIDHTCDHTSTASTAVQAGTQITVFVQAKRGEVSSEEVQMTGASRPSPVSDIELESRTTTSITIRFDAASSSLTHYRVHVDDSDTGSTVTTTTGTEVEFERGGFVAGTSHTFIVYTVLVIGDRDFTSSAVGPVEFYTKPPAPTNVYAVDDTLTTTAITVQWDLGPGEFQSSVLSTTPSSNIVKERGVLQHEFTGLMPGSSLTVSVHTTIGDITSDPAEQTFILKPLAVAADRIVITQGTTNVTVQWTNHNAADSTYDTHRIRLLNALDSESEIPNTDTELASDGASHRFTGLTPGEYYVFSIITYSGNTNSDDTKVEFFTKPLTPTLEASAGTHSITVTMTRPPSDITTDCSDMWLYLDGAKTVINAVESPVTHVYESGISPANTYQLQLRCVVGQDDIQEVSNAATRTVYTKPEPIESIEIVTRTHDTIQIRWTGVAGLTYRVDIFENGNTDTPVESVTLSEHTYRKDGLSPGEQYNFKVYTVYETVALSEPFTEDIVTYPLHPTSIDFTYTTHTAVVVEWVPNSSSSADNYVIQAYTDDGLIASTESSLTSATLHGLQADTRYEIRVYAERLNQRSEDYAGASVQTLSEDDAAVTVVQVTTSTIEVRWSAPPDGNVESYSLTITGGDSVSKASDETSHTFTGLDAGDTYRIGLTIMQGSAGSDIVAADRTVTTQPEPVILGNHDPQENSIVIRWSLSPSSTQQNIKILYTSDHNNGEQTVPATANTATLTGLASGLHYDISIVAISSSVESEPAETTIVTVPAMPTSLSFEVSNTDLVLVWTTGNDDFFDGFQYKCNSPGQLPSYTDTSDHTATISDARPGCTYMCFVRAVTDGVHGRDITRYKTIKPKQPENFLVHAYYTTYITLSWEYADQDACHSGFKIDPVQDLSTEMVNAADRMYNFTRLMPGSSYQFALYTAANNENNTSIYSNAMETYQVTKPVLTSQVAVAQFGTTHLILTYTENNYTYTRYEFMINDPDSTVISKLKSERDRSLSFNGLIPGKVYTLTATVWSEDQQSNPVEFTFNTKPRPPNAEAEAIHGNWMTVRFYYKTNPEYEADEFLVECTNCPSGQNNPIRILPTNNPRNYTGLTPHTDYSFTVIALTNGVQSEPATHILSTSQRAPGPVGAPIHRSNGCGRVIIEWPEPLQKNGVIVQYLINATSNSANPLHETLVQPFDSATLSIELTSLAIGVSYDVTIQAVTIAVGESQEIRIVAEEEQCKPDAQPIGSPATLTKNSTSSLQVTLVNPFNDKPDVSVMSYILLVIRSDERPSNSLLAQTPQVYGTVKGTSPPYIYQPFPSCATFDGLSSGCGSGSGSRRRRATQTTVDIGTDSDCEEFPFEHACNSNQNPTPNECFCNGALQDDSKYYILLRAIGNHGYYADSELSAPFVTAKSVDPPSDDGGTPTWVIILAVVVLIILVAAIVMAVCYVRRRGPFREQPRDTMRDMRMSPNHSSFSKRSVKKTKPSDFRRPVKVADFLEHFAKMSADTDYLFSIEYESLQDAGRDQQAIDAELPENRNKNRFTNILPYDTTRVKLLATDDVQGSDYINANYMPGHNSMREFIVTQGCMPGTRDDFWRMIWEQNCPAIVMLTKCVEKGREKCDHYWPMDSEPMFYGDLQVVSLNETKCPDWIVTEFRISLGDYSRNVKHFHFIAWPDFGIPEKPQALIKFVRLVRNKLMPDGGPVVVHCSAGVGRSGTFIALDRLLQQIKEVDTVDIYNLVAEMRFHRVCMVQTEGQYICIHRCLACVLAGQEHDDSYDYMGEDNDGYDDDEGITVDPN